MFRIRVTRTRRFPRNLFRISRQCDSIRGDGSEIAAKDDLGTLMQKHAAGDTLSITVASLCSTVLSISGFYLFYYLMEVFYPRWYDEPETIMPSAGK